MDERLDGRNGRVWRAYVSGRTQDAIAVEHGISQQRVSQILAEVRQSIPADSRADALLLDLERLDRVLVAFLPIAETGDAKAAGVVLRVTERRAKALGLDAQEPLQVVIERQRDLEGQLVADALAAALDVLQLTEDQRIAALSAAQQRLLGADPPPVPPTPAVPGGVDLAGDYRRFAARHGLDPDEDLDDGEDEDEDGDGE